MPQFWQTEQGGPCERENGVNFLSPYPLPAGILTFLSASFPGLKRKIAFRSKQQLQCETIKDESAELCLIFHNVNSVLYFPPENVVPEIVLCICYDKPVKLLLILVYYGKILHTGVVSRQT